MNNIVYNPSSKQELREILERNKSFVFIKFGSPTCAPCRTITPFLLDAFHKMPFHVICVSIDINESIEVFSFLKGKGVCNTIPTLLCYVKGNMTYTPDFTYSGADIEEISKLLDMVQPENLI